MPLDTFNDRNIENRPGKYYVDGQCLDCDLCRVTAPTVFTRLDSEGYSYVAKQPQTEKEIAQVRESMEGCCTQAIFDDGDQFDWNLEIPLRPRQKPSPNRKSCCGDYGMDNGTTPTSFGGALLKTALRWLKTK